MKKIKFFAFAILSAAVFASCGDGGNEPGGDPDPVPGTATKRYETVPYTPAAETRADGALANLVLTDYDDDHNYYFFVLGHVKSAPLAYRPAIYYDGTTPITVGYSASNVTESSISNSVTETKENSVSKSTSFANANKMRTMVGVEGGPVFVKFKAELEYGHEWTTTEEEGKTTTRSTSNTYETSSSKASEITDEISVTIGTNKEPTGLYRFALFTTTDVYFVVITDRAKTEIQDAQIVYCARPIQFWALDYEPGQDGTFGKTAGGTLLQIPDIADVSELPDVDECEHDWGPWIVSVTATAKTEGSETRTCKLCERTETQVVPVIRTGTFDINAGKWTDGTGNASYTSSNNTLTVNDQAKIIITGWPISKSIVVNGNAFITLKTVRMDNANSYSGNPTPLKLNPGANLTLRLEGTNAFAAYDGYAGIQTTGATLTITGPGSLNVTGGNSYVTPFGNGSGAGAGIGGTGSGFNDGATNAGGTVIIESGTVTAQGGKAANGEDYYVSGYLFTGSGGGAGIGGGGAASALYPNNNGWKGGAGGNITIYAGANVTAIGGAKSSMSGYYGGGAGMAYGCGGSSGTAAQGDPGTIDDRRNP